MKKIVVYVGGEFDPLYKDGVLSILSGVGEVIKFPFEKDEKGEVIQSIEKETANLILINDDGSRDYKFNVPHESEGVSNEKDIPHPFYFDLTDESAEKIELLSKDNATLKKGVDDLLKENETLKASVDDLTKENAALKTSVDDLTRDNAELKKSVAPTA